MSARPYRLRWIMLSLGVILAVSLSLIWWRQDALARLDVLQEWHDATPSARNAVARKLVAQQRLQGLVRLEVVRALGEPDQVMGQQSEYEWFIGERPSGGSLMFAYEEYLVIQFDNSGRVSRIFIRSKD